MKLLMQRKIFIKKKDIKMSKKHKINEKILVLSGIEATRIKKPLYNGFSNGCGLHKNKKKYNRKDKTWLKEIDYND